MDDQACPRCKTTKYRNPSLKLMVNVCGHTLCEACVDLLFLKGSGSCPQCMVPLRRNNFRLQLFEDPMVEKEVDIRRRILRDYNKKQDDFDTLEEYNDYLEEIENIIFNLSYDVNIMETNKMVDAYKRENREQILRNKARTNRDDTELEEMIALEHVQEQSREKELQQIENEQKMKRVRGKEELLENLLIGERDANEIVKEFAEETEKLREEEKILPPMKPITEFSSGIKFGAPVDQTFLPLPKTEEGPTYFYQPLELPTIGPEIPSVSTLEANYVEHLRAETPSETAGGFRTLFACQRALESAYEGLFFKYRN